MKKADHCSNASGEVKLQQSREDKQFVVPFLEQRK